MSSPNSPPALPFLASARDLRSPSGHSEQKPEPPEIGFYEPTRCEVQHDANYPFSSTNTNNVFTHSALPFVAFARDLRSPSVHSEQKSEPPGDN
ncbi:hypothetical protein CDAR_221861 [Caerostris darwini]|uniref:Engrailed n=1 Tax=Caerostris darwini TaxID=1538125 RepID=A0AAV4N065_9ARAC|nr:hypothetical protein CDAR_221861 [Caerostris darwini]